MNRQQLEALPERDGYEETPLLDEIYIIIDRKKHDSGFRRLNIYGTRFKLGAKYTEYEYAKKLSAYSDVVNFKVENIDDKGSLSIDALEGNVFRFFIKYPDYRFQVGEPVSDFKIKLVKVE